MAMSWSGLVFPKALLTVKFTPPTDGFTTWILVVVETNRFTSAKVKGVTSVESGSPDAPPSSIGRIGPVVGAIQLVEGPTEGFATLEGGVGGRWTPLESYPVNPMWSSTIRVTPSIGSRRVSGYAAAAL